MYALPLKHKILSICAPAVRSIAGQSTLISLAIGWLIGTLLSYSSGLLPIIWGTVGILVTMYGITQLTRSQGYTRSYLRTLIPISGATIAAGVCIAGARIHQTPYTSLSHGHYLAANTFSCPHAAAWYELTLIGRPVTALGKKGFAQLKRTLAPWGLEHTIVRSGMHIHLMARSVLTACALIPWWHARIALALGLLCSYIATTPLSVSACRSFLFFALTTSMHAAGAAISREAVLLISMFGVSIVWPLCWQYSSTWLSFALSTILLYQSRS